MALGVVPMVWEDKRAIIERCLCFSDRGSRKGKRTESSEGMGDLWYFIYTFWNQVILTGVLFDFPMPRCQRYLAATLPNILPSCIKLKTSSGPKVTPSS